MMTTFSPTTSPASARPPSTFSREAASPIRRARHSTCCCGTSKSPYAAGGAAAAQGLWPAWLALAENPVLVVRGKNPDILAAASAHPMVCTVGECRASELSAARACPNFDEPEALAAMSGCSPRSRPQHASRRSSPAASGCSQQFSFHSAEARHSPDHMAWQ
jgi:hypothetical protein